MSPKVGPTAQSASRHLWMLLCPLLCALVLADSQSTVTTSLPEDWTGTTIQLQPDLQTEAETPAEAQTDTQTEAQTEVTTEALTETQTKVITNNYTG
ncbi:sushi domain-containing protein 3-like [Lates japonicus]